MVTYTETRKNADDQYLCSVVANCDGVATLQSAYSCGGCEKIVAQHAETIAKLSAERDRQNAAVETIRAELARRADAGEDARLSAVEEVAVRLGADKVRDLGAGIEALHAAHAGLAADHTHPVMACAKHEKKLPPPPASMTSTG